MKLNLKRKIPLMGILCVLLTNINYKVIAKGCVAVRVFSPSQGIQAIMTPNLWLMTNRIVNTIKNVNQL